MEDDYLVRSNKVSCTAALNQLRIKGVLRQGCCAAWHGSCWISCHRHGCHHSSLHYRLGFLTSRLNPPTACSSHQLPACMQPAAVLLAGSVAGAESPPVVHGHFSQPCLILAYVAMHCCHLCCHCKPLLPDHFCGSCYCHHHSCVGHPSAEAFIHSFVKQLYGNQFCHRCVTPAFENSSLLDTKYTKPLPAAAPWQSCATPGGVALCAARCWLAPRCSRLR